MAAMWVIPPFDKFEDCHACFDLGFETASIKQLAFEGGKETLAHGVVETIADRTHRRPHSGLAAGLAKSDRSILATMIGMMKHGGGTTLANGRVECLEY